MTYAAKAAELRRDPLIIVRLDLDTKISGTYEYICDGAVPDLGQNCYSCIKTFDRSPTRIDPEGGIGLRSEVVITVQDFPWLTGAGTYFGRLLANNPVFYGRTIRIYNGFYSEGEVFDWANFQERQLFLRDIQGPDSKGNYKIVASDIMTQFVESLVPKKSNGEIEFSWTSSNTGLREISDNDGFSASGGYAIIEDEIIQYSGISGDDIINVSTRGVTTTEAVAHDSGTPIRTIYHYSGNVADCIRDLINNFTDINYSSYITDADWDTERDTYLSGENVEVWVTEPTPVNELIDELAKETYCNIFYNEQSNKIEIKAIGPTLTSSVSWNDDANILDTSIKIKRPQKEIYSQCWVYFNSLDKVNGGSKPADFGDIYILVDATIEASLGTDRIKRIYSNYIPANGIATASKVASRFIGQHSNPLDITFEVDTKDQLDVEVGDAVNLTTTAIQDVNGAASSIKIRVIEKKLKAFNRWQYRAVYSGVAIDVPRVVYGVIAPNTVVDYTSETFENTDYYAFIANNTPEMSNGDDAYIIL